MKSFVSVFVSVSALFVSTCRAVPAPVNSRTSECTIRCEGPTSPCGAGLCVNSQPPKCGYTCNCPKGMTGALCQQDEGSINMPVVKETVQVKINPIEGLNLPLFGPQSNVDLFNNPAPVVNTTNSAKSTATTTTTTTAKPTTTTTTSKPTTTTTKKTTTTTTASSAKSGGTSSGASGGSSPQEAASSSGQSSGGSSSSLGAASSSGSGAASATDKNVVATTATTATSHSQAGAQNTRPGSLDLGSVPSLSDSLSLAHFGSASSQNTSSSSGNPSADMISKLRKLYSGGHLGTSSASSSSGGTAQQSGTNVSGGTVMPTPTSGSSLLSSSLPKPSSGTGTGASAPARQ